MRIKIDNIDKYQANCQKFIELHSDKDRASEIMFPFFVLYDFRIISTHLTSKANQEDTKKFICARLEVEYIEDNYQEMYQVLISKILESYEEIIELVNSTNINT